MVLARARPAPGAFAEAVARLVTVMAHMVTSLRYLDLSRPPRLNFLTVPHEQLLMFP